MARKKGKSQAQASAADPEENAPAAETQAASAAEPAAETQAAPAAEPAAETQAAPAAETQAAPAAEPVAETSAETGAAPADSAIPAEEVTGEAAPAADAPPRPPTPDRNRELREAVAAAKARLAEKRAQAEAAEAELAKRRPRDVVQAEADAADAAATKADEEAEEFKSRQQVAQSALEVARALAARVKRLENYGQRVTSWIDAELAKNAETEVAAAEKELDEELVAAIRDLKKRRDDEVARINGMLTEHRENHKLLTGSDAGSSRGTQGNKSEGSTAESPSKTKADDSTRRGTSSSPGEVRYSDVQALPTPPSAAAVAAWDLEDYIALNNESRLELSRAQSLKESKKKLKVELIRSLQTTKRMIERDMQALTYKQHELAHQLQARRRRVVELEVANSGLASSLQYAHESLKMVWTKPVEDSMIAQKGTVAPPALKEKSSSHQTPAATPGRRKSTSNNATSSTKDGKDTSSPNNNANNGGH